MSTKIRLTRMGARHAPFYRIVVIDSRRARDSKSIDVLGHYDPLARENQIEINEEAVLEWIGRGALPSRTVNKLLHRSGLLAKWDQQEQAKHLEKREAALRAKAVPLEKIKEKMDAEDASEGKAAEAEPAPEKSAAAKAGGKAAAKKKTAAKKTAAKKTTKRSPKKAVKAAEAE